MKWAKFFGGFFSFLAIMLMFMAMGSMPNAHDVELEHIAFRFIGGAIVSMAVGWGLFFYVMDE